MRTMGSENQFLDHRLDNRITLSGNGSLTPAQPLIFVQYGRMLYLYYN